MFVCNSFLVLAEYLSKIENIQITEQKISAAFYFIPESIFFKILNDFAHFFFFEDAQYSDGKFQQFSRWID